MDTVSSVPLSSPLPPPAHPNDVLQDATTRIITSGIPPFVAMPDGRSWSSTSCTIFPTKLSGFYRLPQETVALIVDHLAEMGSSQHPGLSPHFPRDLPKTDLANCSLSCRAFNPRCSFYLLAYFHFEPPGYRLTQSEGEEVYQRLADFLDVAKTSRRIRTYIAGISLLWGLGMPAFVKLIDLILGAFPKLAALRLYDAPCGSMPILPLPAPSRRRTIESLELGMADSRPVVSTQQWIVEYLRLFHRITSLRFEAVISISDKHPIIRTSHLQVNYIDLRFSCPTIFRVLEQVIVPWSLNKLRIQYGGSWGSDQSKVDAINSFLVACGHNLENVWLWAFSVPEPLRGGEPPDTRRLIGLTSCPRLDVVRITSTAGGWTFEDVHRDLLSCLPQNVRYVIVEFRSPFFPYPVETEFLMDWALLEDALAALPELTRFELRLTWVSQECADEPACDWEHAEQERALAAEAIGWLYKMRDGAHRLSSRAWEIVEFRVVARIPSADIDFIRCDMRFTLHQGLITTDHIGCARPHELPSSIKRLPSGP